MYPRVETQLSTRKRFNADYNVEVRERGGGSFIVTVLFTYTLYNCTIIDNVTYTSARL